MNDKDNIRLAKSVVGALEAERVSSVITDIGYLGMGSEVQEFEREISSFLGVDKERVACVSTGTSALHLAVEAVTSPGDEVLVPSLTYVASYQAISGARAIPVSCEVSSKTLSLDPEDLEARITEKTKAIMPVHYAGTPCALDEIFSIADKYGLRVIEDAAHAFGSKYKDMLVGSFGDICCFSFDGIKNITSGEGGAVVSSDPVVMARVADARLLGVEKDSEKRYMGGRSWEFDVKVQGYRYHMSNLMAAIGRVQLQRFPTEFAPKRKGLMERYRVLLESVADVELLEYWDAESIVPHIMVIKVLNGRRDGLRKHLQDQGIPVGIHYMPNHLLTLYKSAYPLPVTESVYNQIVTLPLHPELSEEQIEMICARITEFLDS